jgi:hypothetical protein
MRQLQASMQATLSILIDNIDLERYLGRITGSALVSVGSPSRIVFERSQTVQPRDTRWLRWEYYAGGGLFPAAAANGVYPTIGRFPF